MRDEAIELMIELLVRDVNKGLEKLATNLGVYRSNVIVWTPWTGATLWDKNVYRRSKMGILDIMAERMNEDMDQAVMSSLLGDVRKALK